MNKFEVGSKLYHFYYGPMTVVECDDKYVEAYFDQPRKDWPIVGTPVNGKSATFCVSSFNYWYFDDVSKIGTESTTAPIELGQSPEALIINYFFLHPYFNGKIKNAQGVHQNC